MDSYKVEKDIWSECDFEAMGWHDVTIWSMFANTEEYEYLFDMDYIFKWVNPEEGEKCFKFWVAPVTMVFENAHSIKIDLLSDQGFIEISKLYKENGELTSNKKYTQHLYRFECQEGEISLKATGFKMYVRKPPMLLEVQSFSLDGRGGISFDKEMNNAI